MNEDLAAGVEFNMLITSLSWRHAEKYGWNSAIGALIAPLCAALAESNTSEEIKQRLCEMIMKGRNNDK